MITVASVTADKSAIFEAEVKRNFEFLERDHGFQLPRLAEVGYAKSMRYESPKIYVSLTYGPPAYEVGISFGRVGIDDQPDAYGFNQGDLVSLNSCAGWRWNPTSQDPFVASISEFARLLRECGHAALQGDQSVFEEMKQRRDAAVQAWHKEERVKSVRTQVERAWQEKNFNQVLALYKSIESMLTPSEKKRLEYARRHSHG
jgi:hypothetical protein